jgi:hypothetical protein
MKPPEIVNATQAELDDLLAKARPTFTAEQYQLLERVFGTFVYVMLSLQSAKTSIKRFRQMLFGARTEHKRNVLSELASTETNAAAATTPGIGHTPPGAGTGEAKARAGHGRNGAQVYEGAPVVELECPDLQPGAACPQCNAGKVYDCPPRTIVKVSGQPPLVATVYKLARLRCRLCDAVFSAEMPPALAALPKYDTACASMIAMLRYGSGMPFFRLEGLQRSMHVPVPDATQWDIVSKALPGPRDAYDELIRQAAQAELLHNDDTPARVLSLMAARAKAEAAGIAPEAKAINTSGIVAQAQDHKIVLFFTGHAHAGKNLAQVLAHRAAELDPPMHMCDGLSANIPAEFATVLCSCLAHGRRQFVDLMENFPKECRHVIEVLAEVYGNDARARTEKMNAAQRLAFHQTASGPPMKELQRWMKEQLDEHLIEPNSEMGSALNYMLKRWGELTLFLRREGAPLDNNICERVLKRAIRHRRNSLFYRTMGGAEVGDIYMSLIHTCELDGVNPFEYLQALQARSPDVQASPSLWMPWNFKKQLAPAA